MITISGLKQKAPLLLLALLFYGCGISSTYRSAELKTIRDFSDNSHYRKTVGVLALSNTTIFSSTQVAAPFMNAFLSSMESAASNSVLLVPGKDEVPPFLWTPPRIANGEIDVFALSKLVRKAGMNAVVSPLLLDIRVRKRDKGFWVFKDVAYSLQIQTAAAMYDSITNTRLALGILTDEIDIDQYEADSIQGGKEMLLDDLVKVAEEMGEELGKQMGDAIGDSRWLTTVLSIEDGTCVISSGSQSGIEIGDRFSVLDSSGLLTGLDGQRYVVPGHKIGEINIIRVSPKHAFGATETGELPPAGSILIPGR